MLNNTHPLCARALLGTLALASALMAIPAQADNRNATPAWQTQKERPLVIGHRGTAGSLPEHTLESYALAIELGADYIEPDLVATKDGVLIARHEPNMIATTNVSTLPQFASRKRKALVDGIEEEGFFASDFTWAEIQQLRAVQSAGERDQSFNVRFAIPSLEQVIQLAKRKGAEEGRVIGIYPETKHPTYHQNLAWRWKTACWRCCSAMAGTTAAHRSSSRASNRPTSSTCARRPRCAWCSCSTATMWRPTAQWTYAAPFDRPYDWAVAGRTGTFGDLLTPIGLAEVRTYADGIGPWKPYLLSAACINVVGGACKDANGDGLVNEADRKLLPPSAVVANAHAQACWCTPSPSATNSAASPATTRACQRPSTWPSTTSVSTACSPTSPTRPSWRDRCGC